MSYRCSLPPPPLHKRSKDWEVLKIDLLNFLGLKISEKLLAKVEENLQNIYAILHNPWISSATAMAMSIYRTLCVLVLMWVDKKMKTIPS